MSGIASMYRIGPSDFFLPEDLRADALTLNDAVNRLNNQNWDKPSQGLYDAFQAFLSEWRAFYSQGFGFFTALNDGNRDQLIQFETRFQALATQYETESGTNIPDIINPSTGAGDSLGAHLAAQLQPLLPALNVFYVLIAVVAIGIGLYVFWPLIMRKRGGM